MCRPRPEVNIVMLHNIKAPISRYYICIILFIKIFADMRRYLYITNNWFRRKPLAHSCRRDNIKILPITLLPIIIIDKNLKINLELLNVPQIRTNFIILNSTSFENKYKYYVNK